MATALKGPCALVLRKDIMGRFSLFQKVGKSSLRKCLLGEVRRVRQPQSCPEEQGEHGSRESTHEEALWWEEKWHLGDWTMEGGQGHRSLTRGWRCSKGKIKSSEPF